MESQEDMFPDDDRGGTTGAATEPVGEGEDSKTGDATSSGDNGGKGRVQRLQQQYILLQGLHIHKPTATKSHFFTIVFHGAGE